MTIKIETYKPRWASLEEMFFERYDILNLLTEVVNVEIDYTNDYNRRTIVKTEFNENNVNVGILFNYLSSIGASGSSIGFDTGQFKQRANDSRDYHRSLAAVRTMHNVVANSMGEKSFKSIERLLRVNLPNFDVDRYLNILSVSSKAMFWYDFITKKRVSIVKRLQALDAWNRKKYNGWREKDPVLCAEYTVLVDHLKVTLLNTTQVYLEQDLNPHKGIHTSIEEISPYRSGPAYAFTNEILDKETKKLESLNLKEFKLWLEDRTGEEYFVTHSSHSGKLTDDNGLEPATIHVTFQKRTKSAADDNLIVKSIRAQSVVVGNSGSDAYGDYDDDYDDDDFTFNSGGNEQYTQEELDNHSNQLNPNNDAYHSSRR